MTVETPAAPAGAPTAVAAGDGEAGTGSDEPKVLVARTALLVRFEAERTGPDAAESFADRLTSRALPVRNTGKPAPLWLELVKRPKEVDELDPAFRRVLGWDKEHEGSGEGGPVWRARRLVLADFARVSVLACPELVDRKIEPRFSNFRFDKVEAYLFPLDAGVLVFHIDWTPDPPPGGGAGLGLEAIEARLAAARRIELETLGWTFRNNRDEAQAALMPTGLALASEGKGRIGLKGICDWLLVTGGEDPCKPKGRSGDTRHAVHHTTVVLDRPLDKDTARRHLFHLRRAADSGYVPVLGEDPSSDQVLRPRGNRWLGVSREGVASLSWLEPWANATFERDQWPTKSQDFYLLLALHVLAERHTLAELALEAQELGADIRPIQQSDQRILEVQRQRIYELAWKTVRYTLSMVGSDCGGLSDYAHFFRTVRAVHGIPAQLEEVRAEVREMFTLAEASWRRTEDAREAKRDERQRKFERRVQLAAVFALPATVVSGLLGMNLPLPTRISSRFPQDSWAQIGVWCAALFVCVAPPLWLLWKCTLSRRSARRSR